MPGPSFVSLDFECANASHASICSIGVARVVDGVVHDPRLWYVRPRAPYDFVAGMNRRITGIEPHQLRGARGFDHWGPHLVNNIGDGIVLGHGIKSADLSMFEQSWWSNGLGTSPTWRFVCTVELARRVMPGLSSYKLNHLFAEVLGQEMVGHHTADADAHATARLAVELLSAGNLDIEQIARIRPGRAPRQLKPPVRAIWSYPI